LFPTRFHAPPNIIKYFGGNNPTVWLEDFFLACRAGRVDDDLFINQYLPLYLTGSAEHGLSISLQTASTRG
jgi:hypothetical protein